MNIKTLIAIAIGTVVTVAAVAQSTNVFHQKHKPTHSYRFGTNSGPRTASEKLLYGNAPGPVFYMTNTTITTNFDMNGVATVKSNQTVTADLAPISTNSIPAGD